MSLSEQRMSKLRATAVTHPLWALYSPVPTSVSPLGDSGSKEPDVNTKLIPSAAL